MNTFNNVVTMAYAHFCVNKALGEHASPAKSVIAVLEIVPISVMPDDAYSRILARVELLAEGKNVGDIKSQH